MACIRMDDKLIVEVWIHQQYFFGNDFFIVSNAFWCSSVQFHLVVDVSAAKGASASDRLIHMSW
jgi:hypothetical protein